MADFKTALGLTMGFEGGYNHGVGENETFFGIDRGYHPDWKGWKLIDQIKAANPKMTDKQLDVVFKGYASLMADKDGFYKSDFWDALLLDQINDQQVANILFDDNVNPCEISAARVMQTAVVQCGLQIVVDGTVGPHTVAAVNSINPEIYYNSVVAIRRFHYQHQVVAHLSQQAWLHSWLNRLTPYKH